MDYYSTLGVNKGANKDDIKKAYRKMANKHHPDKGGDASEFQKIQKAYSVLSDDAKRAQYDNPTQFNFNSQNFGAGEFSGFEDIFDTMFTNRRRRQPRNRDITIGVKITLEEAFSGKNIIGSYRLGNGREESVSIEIPAGAKHGDTIQYAGLGDSSIPNVPRGNLNVRIQVNKHPKWIRDGDNLYLVEYVNVFDLLTGTVIFVNSIDGRKLSVSIPQGTAPGNKFSIKGYGMPNVNTGVRGNAFLQVEARIPKISNDIILGKLREIKDEINKGA